MHFYYALQLAVYNFITFFITYQHALYAERDVVVPVLSLSVCQMPILCQNKWIYCNNFVIFW